MKRIKYFIVVILLNAKINICAEMKNEAPDLDAIYCAAWQFIEQLQKKANSGDADSSLAITDFYKNVTNPNYKITNPSSIKCLTELGLLDEFGNVHKLTKEAFKKFEKLD